MFDSPRHQRDGQPCLIRPASLLFNAAIATRCGAPSVNWRLQCYHYETQVYHVTVSKKDSQGVIGCCTIVMAMAAMKRRHAGRLARADHAFGAATRPDALTP